MRKSLELLEIALEKEQIPYWTKKLGLSRGALHQAKLRGNLSPAIAWALAEELKEDPKEWALLAAAESERDSAAKSRMLKSIAASVMAAGVISGASAAPTLDNYASNCNQLYIMSNQSGDGKPANAPTNNEPSHRWSFKSSFRPSNI